MKSHPFDTAAERLAIGLSRRAALKILAGLAGGAAALAVLPGRWLASARPRPQDASGEPSPPPFWPPDFPLDPPGKAIDDYVGCIADGHTHEECDKGVPWCEIKEYMLNRAFPNLTGVFEIMQPFGEDCGTAECLQCCYVPRSNGCHSSYIGEDVINCNPRIYGAGTRGVGLTLLLQDPPEEGTCLFTPQVCTHVGMCLQGTLAGSAAPAKAAVNYLIDPRAIRQRARVFASYLLTQARHYLDDYATDTPDAPSLWALEDGLLGRGWPTWRQDMASLTFDLNDPLFRVVDSGGALIESASRANVGRTMALLRILTGLPNLAARLEHVESQVWSAAAIDAYLAAVPDPDAALAETLDPHLVAILKRVPSLQDYRLLAAPLAGEAGAGATYGGMPLGAAPELRLSASAEGLDVTLTLSLDDPTGAAGLARPMSVDWGDGRVSRVELAAGQAGLAASHSYAAPGRFAIYAVAASASGLRGAACAVVEVAGPPASGKAAGDPAIARVGLTGLVVANLPYTKELRLGLSLVTGGGVTFPAGRSRVVSGPTNITLPAELGDAYAHNPSREALALLIIEPRHPVVAPVSRRVLALTLSRLLLGVFSTAQMRVVDAEVALAPAMLSLYVAGDPAPLPASTVTVNSDGSLSVPLLHQSSASAPWRKVERIEVALGDGLLDGFVLDAAPTPLAVGTSVAWAEVRPGSFERLPDTPDLPSEPLPEQVFLPAVER